jgi:hypothetical protein
MGPGRSRLRPAEAESVFRFWGGETGSTVAGDRFGPDRGAGSTGLSYCGWLEAGAREALFRFNPPMASRLPYLRF